MFGGQDLIINQILEQSLLKRGDPTFTLRIYLFPNSKPTKYKKILAQKCHSLLFQIN